MFDQLRQLWQSLEDKLPGFRYVTAVFLILAALGYAVVKYKGVDYWWAIIPGFLLVLLLVLFVWLVLTIVTAPPAVPGSDAEWMRKFLTRFVLFLFVASVISVISLGSSLAVWHRPQRLWAEMGGLPDTPQPNPADVELANAILHVMPDIAAADTMNGGIFADARLMAPFLAHHACNYCSLSHYPAMCQPYYTKDICSVVLALSHPAAPQSTSTSSGNTAVASTQTPVASEQTPVPPPGKSATPQTSTSASTGNRAVVSAQEQLSTPANRATSHIAGSAENSVHRYRSKPLVPAEILDRLAEVAMPLGQPPAARSSVLVSMRTTTAACSARIGGAQRILGVDLSSNDRNIDWDALARNNVRFVYLKASQGATVVDPAFFSRWEEAGKRGFLRGAYHTLGSESPAAQSGLFLRVVARGGSGPCDLGSALDIEPSLLASKTTAEKDGISKTALGWLQLVQAALGDKPVVYLTLTSFEMLGQPRALGAYPLWLGDFGLGAKTNIPSAWRDYRFRQFSYGNDANAIRGVPYDTSEFPGSRDSLIALTTRPQAKGGG